VFGRRKARSDSDVPADRDEQATAVPHDTGVDGGDPSAPGAAERTASGGGPGAPGTAPAPSSNGSPSRQDGGGANGWRDAWTTRPAPDVFFETARGYDAGSGIEAVSQPARSDGLQTEAGAAWGGSSGEVAGPDVSAGETARTSGGAAHLDDAGTPRPASVPTGVVPATGPQGHGVTAAGSSTAPSQPAPTDVAAVGDRVEATSDTAAPPAVV
jgi:hypothetical protein